MGHVAVAVWVDVVPADAPHALAAARTLMAERPGLDVAVRAEGVTVAGVVDGEAMRRWWSIALLNERLVAEAAPRRASILRELVS